MGCGASKSVAASPVEPNAPALAEEESSVPVPKPVAFDIPLDEEQSIIKKHPPRRFQRLEEQLPNLISPETLEEKQLKAEERRQEILQERVVAAQKNTARLMGLKPPPENEEGEQLTNGEEKPEEEAS